MDLVSGAVGSVIGKLGELLQGEYKLQKGLSEQIKYMKDELESAQMALSKVGEVPPEQLDPQVRLWASNVREASYDMEDILDTHLIEVADPAEKKDGLSNYVPGFLKNLLELANFFSNSCRTIAGAIEDMKKRLHEVSERRDRFFVPLALPAPATKLDPRLADMHKEAAQLIGINNPRAELIALLLPTSHGNGDSDVSDGGGGGGGSSSRKVVSVVGIGGLGKTTVAKAVYDELKPQFDCWAFVPVGRNPDLKIVFRDILRDLDKQTYVASKLKLLDERQLINELHDYLGTKRYFIVIDDVWDITTWNIIKSALVNNNTGSRVITTTRNRDVASREDVYVLRTLSPDHSEKLFKTRLFGVNGEYPANHPAEAFEKILKKCGGVPLAIITMASLLVGKSREDWFDVCNAPGFYRFKGNQQVDDTEWILSLSYYDMPSHLRTCLLYVSVYPEDYEIEENSLIWKWIAEGFVQKSGSSLFQQGEEYFNQLINRSMIQPVESDDCTAGIVCGCRVHDMVLDLIRDLSNKQNFVTISSNDDEGTSPHQNKVRRLAHQKRIMRQTQQDMPQVRSLVACDCDIDSWVLHPRFKLMRVLDLERCEVSSAGGWQGLEHLGNLLHLRYIGLRGTCCAEDYELPEALGKFKFLQILDLEGSSTGVLPSSICQLTQLVCLCGDRFSTHAPDGLFLGKVTSLEELRICIYYLDVDSQRQFMKDVSNQSELQHLELMDSYEAPDEIEVIMEQMEYTDCNGDAATREWDRVVLPRHLQHLGLGSIPFRGIHLWLRVDHMDESGLRSLGGLPELRFLLLSTARPSSMACTATVANITAVDGFFKKLRLCFLHGWMVQLVLNEDSSGVSFSIWNGKGTMAFRSKTKDKCSRSAAPPPVMPNLLELLFDVHVRALLYKYGNGSGGDLGLECLPSLRRVIIAVNCAGASSDDVEKAEVELRNAAQLHPNGPSIKLERHIITYADQDYKEESDDQVSAKEEERKQSTDQDDKESDDGDNDSAKEEEGGASAAGDEVTVTESGGDEVAVTESRGKKRSRTS